MEMLEQKEGRLIVHLPGEAGSSSYRKYPGSGGSYDPQRHLSEKWNLIFQKPYLWTVPESDC